MSAPIPGVGYFRMSTDDQEASIPRQKEWANRVCPRERIDLVRSFEDAGISGGKIQQRDDLQALLLHVEQAAAKGRPYEVLVCWNPDRLSRADSIRTAGVLARLMDAGVCRILSVEGWVDLNNDTDRVVYTLKQDLGRHAYLKGLSENVLEGKARKARAGRFQSSRPPYGYDVIREVCLENGHLVPNEHAETVRQLFRDYLAGASLRELARGLNARKIAAPRGGEWTRSSVRAILNNRAYCGDLVWNATHLGSYRRMTREGVKDDGQARVREARQRRLGHRHLDRQQNAPEDVIIAKDAHPALVSREDWEAAQHCRKGRLRHASGRGKTGLAWALSGILHCGCCGRVMHACPRRAARKNGKAKVYRYYQCSGRREQGASRCPASGAVDHDYILREAVALLKDHLGSPEAIALVRDRLHVELDAQREAREAEATALGQQAAELDGWIAQGNRNLAILPTDRIPGVVEQVRTWERQRAELSARLAALDALVALEGVEHAEEVEAALALVSRLDELVEHADPAQVRDALAPLVHKVTLYFREATPQERRERGNKAQYVPARLVLEPSPVLLKLFIPTGRPARPRRCRPGPVGCPRPE
jgi:DNA invertase Pin-like site-specific DNA recombinase